MMDNEYKILNIKKVNWFISFIYFFHLNIWGKYWKVRVKYNNQIFDFLFLFDFGKIKTKIHIKRLCVAIEKAIKKKIIHEKIKIKKEVLLKGKIFKMQYLK